MSHELPGLSPEDSRRLNSLGIPTDKKDPRYVLTIDGRLPLAMFQFPAQEIPELVGVTSSSVPSALGWEGLRLPQDVSGLRVLDAGGGGSDMTAEFLEKGADAYAIDPQYDNATGFFMMCLQISGANQVSTRMSEEERHARFGALARFRLSQKQYPDRYVQASMTKIPFPDKHFDIVYSIRAATIYLDLDLEVFRRTMRELIRVGKEVRLLPYKGKDPRRPVLDSRRVQNQEIVSEELKADPNLQVEIHDATTNLGQLLVVDTR